MLFSKLVSFSHFFKLTRFFRSFPSIDFHGKSQRLAVGTHEGTSIVYDLKTATRLYVLDGHRRPMTAVSWSPDGHRLATVSLDESKVCVWKTGLGLLSLIGAPTQRAGSPPFKEWDFHAGDEGESCRCHSALSHKLTLLVDVQD